MQHEIARFDCARGAAALLVFAAHLVQVFFWPLLPPGSWVIYATGILARGAVLAFFVLSGLLITKSIISNTKRNGFFDQRDYLSSRIARIYPPFLFALAITIGVAELVGALGLPGGNGPLGTLRPGGLVYGQIEVWKSLVMYSGLIGVNGPLWSLYIEFKLYLLAMGVALAFAGATRLLRISGFTVAIFVSAFWVSNADTGFWFYAAVWLFGASLNFKRKLYVQLSMAALGGFALLYPPFNERSYLDSSNWALFAQALGCIAFAAVVILPKYSERVWPAFLVRSAAFSYTLYVVHFPILALGLSISIALGLTSTMGATISSVATAAVTLLIVTTIAPWIEDHARFKRMIAKGQVSV